MKIPNLFFKDKLRMEKIKQLCLVCLSIFVIAGCAAHNSNISTIKNNNDLPTVIERTRDSVIVLTASFNDNLEVDRGSAGSIVRMCVPPPVVIRYGGTYITSDNFSTQKIRYQDGVKICTGSTRVWDNQAGISPLLVPFFSSLLLVSFLSSILPIRNSIDPSFTLPYNRDLN